MSEEPLYTDIIIAVHGIGDQSRNTTVRSVASRLAEASSLYTVGGTGRPGFAPQPLGYFHTDVERAVKVVPLDSVGNLTGKLATTGFAEVFWADIPQEVVKEKRTLEETKAWARTVVARAQFLFNKAQANKAGAPAAAHADLLPPDFSLAAQMLEEIVDTVYVLENLTWVAEKAGLMKFDLREVLEEYLGDVQIVTEFELFRHDIFGRFHRALEQVHAGDKKAKEAAKAAGGPDLPPARLHIVAHSEGTVVSFLGLLHAMSNRRFVPAGVSAKVASSKPAPDERARKFDETLTRDWLKHVAGYLTIGSPIDKHLLLWDRLWRRVDLSKSRGELKKCQIRWRNYSDLGDPVGFRLETARQFLDQQGDEVFEFCGCSECRHDIAFARYLLPGKAHNDYWNDPAVFEHFVDSVVAPNGNPPAPPASRRSVQAFGPSIPYIVSAVLLFCGTFLLYNNVADFLNPGLDPLHRYIDFMLDVAKPAETVGPRWVPAFNTLCIAILIGAVTIAARLPLLAMKMWLRSAIALGVGFGAYLCVDYQTRADIGGIFLRLMGADPDKPTAGAGWQWGFGRFSWETWGVFFVSLIVLLCGLSVRKSPSRKGLAGVAERKERLFMKGARPLILCGAIGIAFIVASQMLWSHHVKHAEGKVEAVAGTKAPAAATPAEQAAADEKAKLKELSNDLMAPRRVWPVVLSGLGFLYLWWLATLIFDLAFVWNRYIRGGLALKRLRTWDRLTKSKSDGSDREGTNGDWGIEKCRNQCKPAPAA